MALAIRQPAVAGRFYPRDPKALLADVQSYLSPRQSPTTALGTSRYEALQSLGTAIAEVISKQGERILILASSDMNHYENDQITRIKDHKAIDQILALNPRGLYDVVMKEEISMCGFGPTVAMLTAALSLGATKAELIKYATSGDVSGDHNMVVGYAGIIVS